MNIYHRLESGPFNQTQVSQCCSSTPGLDTRTSAVLATATTTAHEEEPTLDVDT